METNYDKIIAMKRDEMEAEMELQRQTKGLVKLLWSGIAVAGVMIAVGIFMLLSACNKDTATGTAKVTVPCSVITEW